MSIRISMIPVIERFSKSDRWSRSTYRHRRAQRQYIGSAHVEKSNDLIVALRQKHQGMHWSEPTQRRAGSLAHPDAQWRLGFVLAEPSSLTFGHSGGTKTIPSIWRANKITEKGKNVMVFGISFT